MTAVALPQPGSAVDTDLGAFGYQQQPHRGQLMVAFCFAELAARYPISRAIYQWLRRLGSHVVGWTMVIAQIVTIAAAVIAMQAVLPAIWDGFQLVGGDPAISTVTGATNAIVLGLIVLTITTIINSVAVRVMAVINAVGDRDEVFDVVTAATYLVIGLGDVYLGAPLAVPLDPRHRLVTTKYDSPRTWTPQNAVGIGGVTDLERRHADEIQALRSQRQAAFGAERDSWQR